MRVLISADMEGATGVTGWKDVTPGEHAYERFRRLLTGDVNAAIEGAFDGGASEVWVNEAHDGMRNILIEELDSRAELISGVHKPFSMMWGFEQCDLVFFVAYHARAGEPGVLAHTLWEDLVLIELNGQACSEARINAALAGERGIPVALVTGDDLICAEAEQNFPGTKTAVVKFAIDNFSARCLTPQATTARIREAARSSIEDRALLLPFTVQAPVTLRARFREPAQAGIVATLPGITREGPTIVTFQSQTMRDAYALVEGIGTIANTVRS